MSMLVKRFFDFSISFLGLMLSFWLIFFTWFIASIDTRSNGFFLQKRVGKGGRLFTVIKLKTMRPVTGVDTTITSSSDPRITKVGAFWRKTKLDELPQLINVLLGQMSFVGPRPDVPGYADKLQGEDRIVLSIRPGITGPATLKYKNEEAILNAVKNPKRYNDVVIFPDKVAINKLYIKEYSLIKDFDYILETVVGKPLLGSTKTPLAEVHERLFEK